MLSQIRISDVYNALTGAVPRRTGRDTWRGPAPWRGGESPQSVSGDDGRGVWHDFVTNDGGGVLDLVQRIRGGNRADALRWTADLAGVALDDHRPRVLRRDSAGASRVRCDALYFSMAAGMLAEAALEWLPADDPERAVHTALLAALRVSPEAEYRVWLDRDAIWAAALVHSGREHQRRMQTALARYYVAEVVDATRV